jgi:hypothetical protein
MWSWFAPDRGPQDIPAAIAAGIEAGFAWQEMIQANEGVVSTARMMLPLSPLTEAEVIAGPTAAQRVAELEEQLDTVLLYLDKSWGWISASDVDGLLEFRKLQARASDILSAWKTIRGLK